MTDPEGHSEKKSKFYGCERNMMNQGYSKDAAKKICASIARKKARRNYGSVPDVSEMTGQRDADVAEYYEGKEERKKYSDEEMKDYFDGGWRQGKG